MSGARTFVLLGLLWCRTAAAETLEGVVLSAHGPVAGAQVQAYRGFAQLAADQPAFVSTPGDRPGHYRLRLPRGTYYLTARGDVGGEPGLAYHGANPITVAPDARWLTFVVVPRGKVTRSVAPAPHVRAFVSFKGRPVSGAQVSLYPVRDAPFKGLGLLSATTALDGAAALAPPEGRYVVVARQRRSPGADMRLRRGDLFCWFAGNPVDVRRGQQVALELPCYPKQALEDFVEPAALASLKRTSASAARRPAPPGSHVVAGRVVDPAGRPLGGLVVLAYAQATRRGFQMHAVRDRPTRFTETRPDGTYRLELDGPGAYTLVARQRAGGAPAPGELFGLSETHVSHAVDVAADAVVRADIVASRVMAPAPGPPPALPPPATAHTALGDVVLAEDTTWSGEVTVTGVVVVGRRATLTILPGTVVRFVRVDRDGDGVGDGELRVLGRLLARGRPGAPIRFTSAALRPRPADWSYVLLFTARAESELTHCTFEHAFTGVQVHFARAVVRDSRFRGNVEGLRYGRAHMTIERNTITGNTYGIRQHRVEDPVVIAGNTIEDNHVGLFLVPSGQNTIGFSAESYAVADRDRRLPVVRGNTIARNRGHNVRLGERFGYDLDLTGNFWGTTSRTEIARGIFDRSADPTLGAVGFAPWLHAPASRAGRAEAE
ncbi:MAG TPA: right-handed parallel beta-helix repeat-containing protein [Polyangia bacterium]